jgi:hypothetical protein
MIACHRKAFAMKKVLSTSEIVQDLDLETEPKELCAAADADYDERNSTLVIKLDAFVRQVHHAGPDVCTRPEWLPTSETLREGVAPDEAVEMSRDIFHRWVKKVRESVEATKQR